MQRGFFWNCFMIDISIVESISTWWHHSLGFQAIAIACSCNNCNAKKTSCLGWRWRQLDWRIKIHQQWNFLNFLCRQSFCLISEWQEVNDKMLKMSLWSSWINFASWFFVSPPFYTSAPFVATYGSCLICPKVAYISTIRILFAFALDKALWFSYGNKWPI